MEHPESAPNPNETEGSLRDLATTADGPPAVDSEPPAPAPEASQPPPPPAPAPDSELARLREEVARHKTEIARLTQLTSLYSGSGTGAPPPAPRKFEDLNDREMETEIRRMARGLDGF